MDAMFLQISHPHASSKMMYSRWYSKYAPAETFVTATSTKQLADIKGAVKSGKSTILADGESPAAKVVSSFLVCFSGNYHDAHSLNERYWKRMHIICFMDGHKQNFMIFKLFVKEPAGCLLNREKVCM